MKGILAEFIMGQHHQELMHMGDAKRVKTSSALRVESLGKVPAMEFRQLATGQIVFRYAVDDTSAHLGFDGVWREMSEYDRRQTLLMGGRVAEWLKSLGDGAGE